MKHKRFVDYFLTPKTVIIRSLSCSKKCQGVRVYSSQIAVIINDSIEVLDSKTGNVIDKNLEDVFYFPSGESIKKYKNHPHWQILEKQGDLVCKALIVKVLSNRYILLKNLNNQWILYVLSKNGFQQHKIVSLDTNINDVDCHFKKGCFILSLKYQDKIILQQRSNLCANIISELELKDYNNLNHGYLSASFSQNLIFLDNINGCQISIPQYKEKLSLYNVEHGFKLLDDNIDELLVFNNGVYLIKKENTWSFYSTEEKVLTNLHLYNLEVTENGDIYTKETKESNCLKKIGQYNNEFVMLTISGKTIICDGKTIIQNEQTHYQDIVII